MAKKLVFYHDDVDGFTAAWVFWRHWGYEGAEYHPVNYTKGDEFLKLPPVDGREVYFVDFCPENFEQLQLLYYNSSRLVILDHHRTAQPLLQKLKEEVKELPPADRFSFEFDLERAGAMLAWYYCDRFRNRRELSKVFIEYVEDRDLWRFKLPSSKAVNAYIGCQEKTFERWSDLEIMGVMAMASHGEAILDSIAAYVKETTKHFRFVEFMGYKNVAVVNAAKTHSSELLGTMAAAEGVDFAVGWFQRGDGSYEYQLRSRGDVDVAEIAKECGGGGHAKAAGFVVRERVLWL